MEIYRDAPDHATEPMDTSEAVKVLGRDPVSGRLDIQINPAVPDPSKHDMPASEAQLRAVQEIVPFRPETLTNDQCHAMLSYRDYARAVVTLVMPEASEESTTLWVMMIVALLSRDPPMSKDIVRWSSRRFSDGADTTRIQSTKHFDAVIASCCELEAKLAQV